MMTTKNLWNKAEILRIFFPNSSSEWRVFAVFFVLYAGLGYFIAYTCLAIYHPEIPWDAYWSFDNRAIVITGGGADRHPLSLWLFRPQYLFLNLIGISEKDFAFRLWYAWVSAGLMALSCSKIWRILFVVLELPSRISAILVLMFAGFSSSILLSFTPETYVWRMYFLLVFVNYYLEYHQNNYSSVLYSIVFTCLVGGLTITNALKIWISPFFTITSGEGFWPSLKKILVNGLLSISVFAVLLYIRFGNKIISVFSGAEGTLEKFSKVKLYTPLEYFLHWFCGANVVFPDFITKKYHSETNFFYNAIFPDLFRDKFQIALLVIFFVCIVVSIFLSYKKSAMWLLLSWWAVDFLLHVVVKFGISSSFVYGGHFVFLYPIILGIGYSQSRKQGKTFSRSFEVFLILICFGILINNTYQFLQLADLLHQIQ